MRCASSDDITYSNIVSNSILTGKSGILGDSARTSGIHTIKVHKNNWKEVMPNLDSLDELKAADSLYPYNHKLLIEGYSYHTNYPVALEKIYTGVDLFAETLMIAISPFDLANNVPQNKYDVYALDNDAQKSHSTPYNNHEPTRVIVIKTDYNNPDFQNERFVLRFTLINELRKYLRLRADLSTEDEQVTPTLHSYKIKLG